jgi:NAD(P)-dependent dehydrogenase (short-subunit alcohol dehydrogenase family)
MRSGAHALVVGGTGMLRGVSLDLAARGMELSVIARNEERLRRLAAEGEVLAGAIHPVPLDYRDTDRLTRALAAARKERGPITLAVLWVRAVAPHAAMAVARAIASPDDPPRLFHLRGSAARDPSAHRTTLSPSAFGRIPAFATGRSSSASPDGRAGPAG